MNKQSKVNVHKSPGRYTKALCTFLLGLVFTGKTAFSFEYFVKTFQQSLGRISRNSAETTPFCQISTRGSYVKFWYFTQ